MHVCAERERENKFNHRVSVPYTMVIHIGMSVSYIYSTLSLRFDLFANDFDLIFHCAV